MSWICPFCGYENHIDPLNSRHHPECKGCGEDHISPDTLEAQIRPQIKFNEDSLKEAKAELGEARDHISSLKDELSSWNLKYESAKTDVAGCEKELKKLRDFKIYREGDMVDKAAKARLDIHQKTLPLPEGVPA
jgi:hypothetical protein